MAPAISVGELTGYLREAFSGGGDIQVDLVNDMLREDYGDRATWPAVVRAIALEAAARAYRRSAGRSSITIAHDGTSRTERAENEARDARRGVYFTDDERVDIAEALLGATVVRQLGSIPTHVPVTWPTSGLGVWG